MDLVITDVMMPGMTGPELARYLRDRHPGLPVIFTSGYPVGVLGGRAPLDPDDTLIEKPFTRTSVLAAVNWQLREPRTGA